MNGDPNDYGDRDGTEDIRWVACKFCDASITFSNRVPIGEDGRQHRCMASSRAARGYTCNRCKAPITFTDRKPFNLNGTPHRCIADARAKAAPVPMPTRASRADPSTGELFGGDAR